MAAVFGSPLPQPVPRLPRPSSSLHSFLSTQNLPSTSCRRDRHASALQSPPPSISGCGAGGRWSIEKRIQESLAILDLMESQSISLDASLLCSVLKSCADARSLRLGRLAYDKALRAGLHADPYVANSLLLLYSRCGLLDAARQLFDEMPLRNVVTWTTAISMYQQAGFPHVALDLYRLMCDGADQAIKPNAFTYCAVLNCCASVKDLGLGVRVHEQIIEEGLQNDRFLIVALIDMYTKCGNVSHARKVFDCVPQPTIEAYTAMIEGYSGNGLPSESLELIRMVLRTGPVADKVTGLGFMTVIRPCVMQMSVRHGQEIHAHIVKFGHIPGYKQLSAIVSLYERCDKMLFAYRLFNELEIKDFGLWRRLLSGFLRNKLNAKAMKFFAEMMTSLELGHSSFAVIDALKACIGMKGLKEGRQIHALIIKVRSLMGSTSCACLVELYSCCGDYEEALKASIVFGNKKLSHQQKNSNSELMQQIHASEGTQNLAVGVKA